MATDAMPKEVTDKSWLPNKGQVGFGIDFAVRIAPPKDAKESSGAVGEFFWDGAASTLFWVDPKNDIAAVLFTQMRPFDGCTCTRPSATPCIATIRSRSRTDMIKPVVAWAISLAMALAAFAPAVHAQSRSVVQEHGQLRVQGNRIVDQAGAPVQLRGMSLYWSQWIPKYYTANTVKWLRDDWKVTVVRAAMAVKAGGYEKNPAAERDKVIAVVDAAIQSGIYVIIDYHAHTAHENLPQAQAFFADMARRYGDTPNVLYEPYNEPLDVSWAKVLKPYHEAVIDSIRKFDPDNIVIVGTRNWSQQVAEAAANPVSRNNVAYALHFYANTHGQSLRDDAQKALNLGAALFVTEYGTTDATGDGKVNEAATREWWAFLDRNFIGHLNWSVADIRESSAALFPGASPDGGWTLSQIKPSGILVRDELRAKAPRLSEKEVK